MINKQKLKKGDKVIVVTGKDFGKTGEILKMFPKENRVIVAGVAIYKKHQKPTRTSAGGIIEKEAKIQISNIAYLDPKENVATKVGFKILENGKKVRFAKKSGEIIDQA